MLFSITKKFQGEKFSRNKLIAISACCFFLGFITFYFINIKIHSKHKTIVDAEQANVDNDDKLKQIDNKVDNVKQSEVVQDKTDVNELEENKVDNKIELVKIDAGLTEKVEENTENQNIDETPPQKLPSNLNLKEFMYWRCWVANNENPVECDQLPLFEKRLKTRLYVLNECAQNMGEPPVEGVLSLGVRIDFDNQSISFWSGKSSTTRESETLTTCFREKVKKIPFEGIEHKNVKYSMFAIVEFLSPLLGTSEKQEKIASKIDRQSKAKISETPALKQIEKQKTNQNKIEGTPGNNQIKRNKNSKIATAKIDRVRVRLTQPDGEVIDKLRQGETVEVISREGRWFKIITLRKKQGYVHRDTLLFE